MPIKVTPKKPANPGREGTKREPTQAEVDARRARMNEARMEAHKKNKTGPFRIVPGRKRKAEGGSLSPEDVRKVTNKVKKFSREFKLSPGTIEKMKEIRDGKKRKPGLPSIEKVIEKNKLKLKEIKKREDMKGPKGPTGRPRKMGGGMMQMPRAMYKKGGKSFPDLSGDGKVTMKDILMGRGVIPRKGKKGGGLMEATSRLRAQGLKKGGIARGCGAVMNDRRKVTKMY